MNNYCPDICLNMPYPEPEVTAPCRAYAMKLMRLYAGGASELTAIAQYTYQVIMLEGINDTAAATIECISIAEMKHFELLGILIKLLGGDPRLQAPANSRGQSCRGNGVWWNGSLPDYSRTPDEMLAADIRSEQGAIEDYRRVCGEIDDPKIKRVLERIIADERRHLELFREMAASLR